MIIQTSGKFILAGEHFILYGCPALALPWHSAHLTLTSAPAHPAPEPLALIEAWQLARSLLSLPKDTGFPFTIHSDIPFGCGFGSSAALCVALLRAAAYEANTPLDDATLIEHATTLEALFHGRSSGLDPAVVVRQTPLRFQIGQPPQPWSWKLQGVGIVLAVSQEQRKTAVAVERVRHYSQRYPARFEALLSQARDLIEALQTLCASAPTDADQQRTQGRLLGTHLDHNHALLAEMDISAPHLESLIQCARNNGAWGAKLTGAGMGGGMIAVAGLDALPSLAEALHLAGATTTHVHVPSAQYAPSSASFAASETTSKSTSTSEPPKPTREFSS